jgi:hypothetical protein
MRAYGQWLRGVRRRAAVRWRCWRWVEEAVSGAPGKRFSGIAAALATAALLGAAVGVAAKHAGACNANAGPPRLPAHGGAAYPSLPHVGACRATGCARSSAANRGLRSTSLQRALVS